MRMPAFCDFFSALCQKFWPEQLGKKKKMHPNWKGRNKIILSYLFTDIMILNLETLKIPSKNVISEFGKVVECKNPLHFYTLTKMKIRKGN